MFRPAVGSDAFLENQEGVAIYGDYNGVVWRRVNLTHSQHAQATQGWNGSLMPKSRDRHVHASFPGPRAGRLRYELKRRPGPITGQRMLGLQSGATRGDNR